jgi:hypothetical protein
MSGTPSGRTTSAREAVRQYRSATVVPQVLREVQPVVEATLLAVVSDDDAVETVRVWAALLTEFLAWRREFGDRITDPARLLIPFAVESFLAQRAIHRSHTPQSRASHSASLRRLALRLDADGWDRQKVERVRADPPCPYSIRDRDRLLLAARSVPSRVFRPRAEAVTLACLAAGLSTTDLRTVGPEAVVREDDGAVVVHVGGALPRMVVALDAYGDDLIAACSRLDSQLLTGNNPNKKSLVQDITEWMRRVDGRDFSVQRLRSTWIVHHLENGVPFADLAAAAGLRNPDGLLRYTVYARPNRTSNRSRFRGVPA